MVSEHDPEWDKDEFAACRNLLIFHGHEDIDPSNLECDVELSECPVRNWCGFLAHIRQHDSGKEVILDEMV